MPEHHPLDRASFDMLVRESRTNRSVSTAKTGIRKTDRNDADLERASEQFESLLLNLMIREMRATIPESGLFPKSMSDDIYTGMLDEQMAQEMAQSGGIGISRMIFHQLKGVK